MQVIEIILMFKIKTLTSFMIFMLLQEIAWAMLNSYVGFWVGVAELEEKSQHMMLDMKMSMVFFNVLIEGKRMDYQ